MSNKPKGVKRLVEYKPTKAERRHKSYVREAIKQGAYHAGSKKVSILRRIIPTRLVRRLQNMLGIR